MIYAVNFSPEAQKTFEDVTSQLRQRWGEKHVDKFKSKVSKALTLITTTPFIFPLSGANEELRKCVIHKNCSMYYVVRIDYIEILYFWDNRQDPIFLP